MTSKSPERASFIHQFELGPWDNFIYFIGDRETREAAVVDPAWDHDVILAEAEKLDITIRHILCTHSHFDHVNRVDALLDVIDVPVHMLATEIEFSGFQSENLRAHAPGDRLSLGKGTDIAFVHTPGHTPGSVCYAVDDSLVTGDTLFVDGCGRCDFVGGDPEIMFHTLRSLVDTLPAETRFYPGHHYGNTPTSTLDEQLQSNPYLKLPTLTDFVTHRMQGKTPNTPLPTPPTIEPTSDS